MAAAEDRSTARDEDLLDRKFEERPEDVGVAFTHEVARGCTAQSSRGE